MADTRKTVLITGYNLFLYSVAMERSPLTIVKRRSRWYRRLSRHRISSKRSYMLVLNLPYLAERRKTGYRVFATARDLTTVQELVDKYSIETLHLDVTSIESVGAAVEEISRRTGGKLDVLVNNA